MATVSRAADGASHGWNRFDSVVFESTRGVTSSLNGCVWRNSPDPRRKFFTGPPSTARSKEKSYRPGEATKPGLIQQSNVGWPSSLEVW